MKTDPNALKNSEESYPAPVPSLPSELREMMKRRMEENRAVIEATGDEDEAEHLRAEQEKIASLLEAIKEVRDDETSEKVVTFFLNARLAFKDILNAKERKRISDRYDELLASRRVA